MISNGSITRITNDHTYVYELVKAGQLTIEQARRHPKRNVLTRVLGIEPTLLADGYICELESGSSLLLCSDGLTNMLSETKIIEIIESILPEEDKVRKLIDKANDKGGTDNVTVILINLP